MIILSKDTETQQKNRIKFLYATYITYIILFIFVSLRDYSIENYDDMYLEIVSTLVSIIGLSYFHIYKNLNISTGIAIWIAYSLILALLVTNQLNHYVVMYAVIVPILPFFLFRLYTAFIHIFLFYIFFGMSIYFFIPSTDNSFLNDADAIFNLLVNILFIFALGISYHISIKKSYQKLEIAYQQNQMLLKEVHHRVKNNLNMIVSLIGLQIHSLDKERSIELSDIKNRIEAIALTHEMLYKEDSFLEIEFYKYIKQLSSVFNKTYQNTKEIKIYIEADAITLPIGTMIQLGLLCNELLTNSFKHAFDKNKGEIYISLKRSKRNQLHFIYRDSGKGLEKSDISKSQDSLGMILISSTTQQLGGEPIINSYAGFSLELYFSIIT